MAKAKKKAAKKAKKSCRKVGKRACLKKDGTLKKGCRRLSATKFIKCKKARKRRKKA